MHGLPDPSLAEFPRLDYVIKGLRREGAFKPKPKRLPITPFILRSIHTVWSGAQLTPDRVMLWAAFCLGFFGFMRAGEFTCPSHQAFTQEMLTVDSIAVDSHENPKHLSVFLKHSKTDQFGVGTFLHLGATGSSLCPVAALLSYLAQRPRGPGFLFLFEDGSTLSKQRLTDALHAALQEAGIDDSRFTGHSFRIGAATTAAQVGLEDSLIQTLGRWKSSAFRRYIRTPWQTLTEVSGKLVSSE